MVRLSPAKKSKPCWLKWAKLIKQTSMADVNPIVAENLRNGTDGWQLTRPATSGEIEGYASATSVNRGDAIHLFVNTKSPTFMLEIFRMGWYQGLGARRVVGPIVIEGTQQVMPIMDAETGLVDCNWISPFILTTRNPDDPTDWVSGVYLAKLTTADCGAQSYIIFVVRDDQRSSSLLFQVGVTTYQAYNYWGGKSLYNWGSTEKKRAAKVSFNRPYAANAQNPDAAYGMGAGEFLTNLQPHPDSYGPSNAAWDYNMVRWLEREAYDLSYCTSLDTHSSSIPLSCKAWLAVGHDEYWSWEMREHVEAARDAGVHLGFFAANCAYWQVRFETSSASGSENRIMVCYKKSKRDPIAASDMSRATDKWRCETVNRPESQLIGVMYAGDPVDGDIVIKHAEHWVFANTGLKAGDKLPGLLGYEVDSVSDVAHCAVQILAESPWTALNDNSLHGVAHMSIYSAVSGAMVFATGTIQWAWGLDDYPAPSLRTSRLNSAAQQITRNVLNRFIN
jgi:hypothetical protein